MTAAQPERSLADGLVEVLYPLIEQGNVFAMGAMARLIVAEDVDAEAERVLAEMTATMRHWGEICLSYGAPEDSAPYDRHPGRCWRCDAADADGQLGLCADCRVDLVARD
jgi:hypothetical protein